MDTKYRARTWRSLMAIGILALFAPCGANAQTPAQTPPQIPAQAAPQAQALPTHVTLDQAIALALQHNHSLQAARTLILQSQAEEITANLRPDPVLLGDAQFLPIFHSSDFTNDYLDNSAQFDLGVGYLFERGKRGSTDCRLPRM